MFVTRKLTVSVGEVVNGGPLPPVPRHTPVCSFNSQSKYIGESLVVEPPTSAQRASADAAGERVASQRRPLGSRSPGLGWVRVCASAQRLAVALRLSPVSQDCVTVLGPPARLTHRGPPWGPCHCARRPAGGDRGEESGAEPDAPPPGLLPQPAPAPAAPPHLPAPAPGAVRGLFPPPGPTPGPPALLPAQQAPMYSDEVRSAARPPRARRVQCACVYGAGSPRGLCVCSGMFRASCGGSQSGPWPAGFVLCLRQGARVSLKRSRNSGGRAGGFRGPAVAAGAVLPCVRRLPCRRDRDRAVPVPPAPL